jgi:hypothetical protein
MRLTGIDFSSEPAGLPTPPLLMLQALNDDLRAIVAQMDASQIGPKNIPLTCNQPSTF